MLLILLVRVVLLLLLYFLPRLNLRKLFLNSSINVHHTFDNSLEHLSDVLRVKLLSDCDQHRLNGLLKHLLLTHTSTNLNMLILVDHLTLLSTNWV